MAGCDVCDWRVEDVDGVEMLGHNAETGHAVAAWWSDEPEPVRHPPRSAAAAAAFVRLEAAGVDLSGEPRWSDDDVVDLAACVASIASRRVVVVRATVENVVHTSTGAVVTATWTTFESSHSGLIESSGLVQWDVPAGEPTPEPGAVLDVPVRRRHKAVPASGWTLAGTPVVAS